MIRCNLKLKMKNKNGWMIGGWWGMQVGGWGCVPATQPTNGVVILNPAVLFRRGEESPALWLLFSNEIYAMAVSVLRSFLWVGVLQNV